jgi:hypothetical protein
VTPTQVQPLSIPKAKKGGSTFASAGELRDLPLAGQQLPFALEPLAAFQDRLTILQGLSGKHCNGAGGGHSTDFAALGYYLSRQGVVAETVDLALARARPGVFPHVGLGMADKTDSPVICNCSAIGKSRPAPTILSPELAHDTLFGSVAAGAGK